MRILFLSNFFPPAGLGGYEQWCQEVAVALRARGHDIVVLTSDYRRYGLDASDPNWIRRELHMEMELESSRNAFNFFTNRNKREKKNLSLIKCLLDDFAPDAALVWGMWNLHRSLPALLEEALPGRLSYYISDYWPTHPSQFENYWNADPRNKFTEIPKLLLKPFALKILSHEKRPQLKMNHALCCSEFVRDTLVTQGKLSTGIVLHGGTDPRPFLQAFQAGQKPVRSKGSPLRLLYFGRLIPDKGVHTAVEALGLLKKQNRLNGTKLTILGSGDMDYINKLSRSISTLGLLADVEFVPSVARDEMPTWLAKFDAYLFTSIWPEPMARSVMEAMASGLLVIGTRVGGQSEMLVHNENSLTFQAGNAEDLADKIFMAFSDTDLCMQLSKSGQLMILEKFTLERMVNSIEAYLTEMSANTNILYC